MKRVMALIYSIISYFIFFGTFIYAVLFLGDFGSYIPKTVNSGVAGDGSQPLLVNLGLIFLFGFQHTLMARKSFKKWWTTFVPKQLERSTYVLFSSLALILLFWLWRPLPDVIWEVEATWASLVLEWGFWLGWLVVFLSTWMIDHFHLFGLKQAWTYWNRSDPQPPEFQEPGLYKYVRHPLMLGFLIAFWSTSFMSAGHLVFSAGMTLYIIIGVYFEERAMARRFGEEYEEYRERVPRFFPGLK